MIFPILKGIVSPFEAPITFLLFAINLMVFIVTCDDGMMSDNRINAIRSESGFSATQGAAFADMIAREPGEFSPILLKLAANARQGETEARDSLSRLSHGNARFMATAAGYRFEGDEVAIALWRERFKELQEINDKNPSYHWGISHLKDGWMQYVSYQFAHGGFGHLFYNMLFLVLFGAFLETSLGGSFVILTYLISGLCGAILFSKTTGVTGAPLVGASAGVSGLMALASIAWIRKEKVHFFYYLLPFEGYFGIVALPSWLLLYPSFLGDVAGALGSSSELGRGVAFTAHIGGTLAGAAVAILYLAGVLQKDFDDAEGGDGDAQEPADEASSDDDLRKTG